MGRARFSLQRGFSLVELIVVMAISSVLMGAVMVAYTSFIDSVSRQSALDTINMDVKSTFKLLENDIMMSGFGLPKDTRVAADYNCNASDENFCKTNSDRLFLADGWEILSDLTVNHEDDGSIDDTHLSLVADARNNIGGYRAQLTSAVVAGGTSMPLNTLNIDSGDENTASPPYDNDFKASRAFVIADGSSKVEGHRINTVAGSTVTMVTKETFKQSFANNASHAVVPATCWYLRLDPDGRKYPDNSPIYWLYRNNDRVIPYVDDFKIQYGMDANSDGIQAADWSNTIPPAANPDGAASYSSDQLKTVRVSLRIKYIHKDSTRLGNYQTSIQLRN